MSVFEHKSLSYAVGIIYRYFSGNYHFLGSFSEWYGTPKSGMVTLDFGLPAPASFGSLGGVGELGEHRLRGHRNPRNLTMIEVENTASTHIFAEFRGVPLRLWTFRAD